MQKFEPMDLKFHHAEAENSAPTPKRVLLVDDNESLRGLMAEILEESGYQVAQAGNGSEALAALAEMKFNIIITDLVMPGIDGWSVVAEARRRYPQICTVVMTGYCDNIKPPAPDEVDMVTSKPINLNGLLTIF